MQSYLFIDTETSDFVRPKLKHDDPKQGKIIQLAYQLTHDTRPVETHSELLWWPGITVSAGANKVHGISAELCQQYGNCADESLKTLMRILPMKPVIVGHNVSYDINGLNLVADAFGHRSLFDELMAECPVVCTMDKAKKPVNLPPTPRMAAAGRTCPKAPKLQEAYKHFFGDEFDDAHDALADVFACRDIFFAMKKQGIVDD